MNVQIKTLIVALTICTFEFADRVNGADCQPISEIQTQQKMFEALEPFFAATSPDGDVTAQAELYERVSTVEYLDCNSRVVVRFTPYLEPQPTEPGMVPAQLTGSVLEFFLTSGDLKIVEIKMDGFSFPDEVMEELNPK